MRFQPLEAFSDGYFRFYIIQCIYMFEKLVKHVALKQLGWQRMKVVKYMYNVVTSWKFEVCLQFFSVIPKKVILFQKLFCLLSFQSLPVLPVFPRVTHQMRSPYCKENCQYFRLFPRNAMAHYIIMSVFSHLYSVGICYNIIEQGNFFTRDYQLD